MQVIESICIKCKHYDSFSLSEMVCKAFPGGIPDKYKLSEEVHNKTTNGYKYEPLGLQND